MAVLETLEVAAGSNIASNTKQPERDSKIPAISQKKQGSRTKSVQNPVPFRPKTPRFAAGWTPAPWRDPSPLKVKEVRVDERRYVALREQLQRGDKSLVGNKGSDPISPPQLAFSMPDSGRRLLA